MTDLQILFLVLVAIYGWECLCWVPRGSVVYRNWFSRHAQLVHPGALFGNQSGGFVLACPLPPLGSFFWTHPLRASLSPEAIVALVASALKPGLAPSQASQPLDKIRTVTAEARKVLVNGEVFIRAASPGQAIYLAEVLQELKSMAEIKRAKAIQRIARDALDAKAIQDRCQELQDKSHLLRGLTNGLFVYVFILIPIVIWRFGLVNSWAGLLAGLLMCTTMIALLFRRLHNRFFPADEDGRFTHFLTILLSPATAVRALDLLSRPLLENFHALAVARVLCSEKDFAHFAARFLRDLRYPPRPIHPCPEPAAVHAESPTRRLFQNEIEQALKRWGVDSAKLLQPPTRLEITCRSYCPRCLAQFTTASGVCEDCGGVLLIGFDANEPLAS